VLDKIKDDVIEGPFSQKEELRSQQDSGGGLDIQVLNNLKENMKGRYHESRTGLCAPDKRGK